MSRPHRSPVILEREFYILSLKWTRRENCLTWWRPDAAGYTWKLEEAGRYTGDDVKRRTGYLNDGENTVALPCDVVDKHAARVVLLDAAHALLSEVLGRPTTLAGSVIDDQDHEHRNQCPSCERPYGSPGPSRLIHHARHTPSLPTKGTEEKFIPR